MIFCDSSAIVSVLLEQPGWEILVEEIDRTDRILVWWGTSTECVSAIARLRRDNELDDTTLRHVIARFDAIEASWLDVPPTGALRDLAKKLLFSHPLRAADALQLAAAMVVSEGVHADLPFVCLDQRLCAAARKEGFPILP